LGLLTGAITYLSSRDEKTRPAEISGAAETSKKRSSGINTGRVFLGRLGAAFHEGLMLEVRSGVGEVYQGTEMSRQSHIMKTQLHAETFTFTRSRCAAQLQLSDFYIILE
jgi:hypothetical protein